MTTPITSAAVHRLLMKMPRPFGHAAAVRSEAEILVVELEVEGTSGLGEAVPRVYVTGETADSAYAALSSLDFAPLGAALDAPSFGACVERIEGLALAERLAQSGRPGLAASCAVELALLDVAGKRFGVSLAALGDALDLPPAMRVRQGPVRLSKPLDFLSTLEDLDKLERRPAHIKVKAGRDAERDLAVVRGVRERLGNEVTLSLDANMAWTFEEALARVEQLRAYDVGWYEEPLAQYHWKDYRELRRRTGARIMLDESLCSLADGRMAIEQEAADLFNVRISKCGGLIGALRLAKLAHAQERGLQLGVHPGQTGILGAAGARFLEVVGTVATLEGGGTWIGTGGHVDRTIDQELRLETETARCAGLGPLGLGVTPRRESIDRLAIARATWRAGTSWEAWIRS